MDGISSLQFNLLPQDVGTRIVVPKIVTRQMGQHGGYAATDRPVTGAEGCVSDGLGALEVAIAPIAEVQFRFVIGIFLLGEVLEGVLF